VNVLLIGDNPQMERFIRAALARRLGDGVRVESQSTLSQALDTLKYQPFHAVVVDFSASDLQAPEGLARVGAIAQRFPVVVLIDQDQTDLLIAARDSGIRNWLAKDTLTPSRLADRVSNALAVKDVRKGG